MTGFPEPSEVNRAVGHVVAHHRIIHEWTQNEIATRSGLSQNGISEIESARRGITFYTFLRLGHALDLSPVHFLDMILNRIGERPQPLPRLGTRKPNNHGK